MATGSEIVNSAADLVDALSNLVATDTFEAVIEVAKAVGAQGQINSGVDALVSLLEEIQEGLEKLREPLIHVGALDGMVDLIRPLIESLSQAGGDLAQDLESMGLSGFGDVVEPVLEVGPRALNAAGAFLEAAPDLDSVTNLQQEISQFGETLQQYKEAGGASE